MTCVHLKKICCSFCSYYKTFFPKFSSSSQLSGVSSKNLKEIEGKRVISNECWCDTRRILKRWMGCPILSVWGNPKPEWLLIKMWIEFAFPPPPPHQEFNLSLGIWGMAAFVHQEILLPPLHFSRVTKYFFPLLHFSRVTCFLLMWFSKNNQESSLSVAYFVKSTKTSSQALKLRQFAMRTQWLTDLLV